MFIMRLQLMINIHPGPDAPSATAIWVALTGAAGTAALSMLWAVPCINKVENKDSHWEWKKETCGGFYLSINHNRQKAVCFCGCN